MSYSSVTEFKLHSFPSGSFNSFSDTKIEWELNAAAGQIDAALRPYHTLPLSTGSLSTSDLTSIKQFEIVIASYNMMVYRGFKPNIEGSVDQVLYNRYLEITDRETGLLFRLAKGEYLLAKEADATPTVREKRSKMYGTTGRVTRFYDSAGNEYI